MNERACSQGCTLRGQHYAACPAYGTRGSDECAGCVPAIARDGSLVCASCYGDLRRRLELVPTIIGHIREQQHTVRAKPISRVRRGNRVHTGAPASPDMLDALSDITKAFTIPLDASTSAHQLREATHGAVGELLAGYDEIANDAEAFAQWWHVVMPAQIPDAPDYWTVTRALYRWPLEDRRRWAPAPCPDCDLRTVTITPPTHAGALTWYRCTNCKFEGSEEDMAGLWRAVFGEYSTDLMPINYGTDEPPTEETP